MQSGLQKCWDVPQFHMLFLVNLFVTHQYDQLGYFEIICSKGKLVYCSSHIPNTKWQPPCKFQFVFWLVHEETKSTLTPSHLSHFPIQQPLPLLYTLICPQPWQTSGWHNLHTGTGAYAFAAVACASGCYNRHSDSLTIYWFNKATCPSILKLHVFVPYFQNFHAFLIIYSLLSNCKTNPLQQSLSNTRKLCIRHDHHCMKHIWWNSVTLTCLAENTSHSRSLNYHWFAIHILGKFFYHAQEANYLFWMQRQYLSKIIPEESQFWAEPHTFKHRIGTLEKPRLHCLKRDYLPS